MTEDLIGRRRGLLFILSSPSGAGKSTISRRLLAEERNIVFSVSATTRAPRPGEKDGREYYFKSRDEFEAMIAKGQLLEHAEVFGNLYGTPIAPVEKALAEGIDVLFDIDWQGGQQIANSALEEAVVSIFILPPSLSELETRLKNRAEDSDEVIAGRMEKSIGEINHWSEYDYVLVNDDLEKTAEELIGIVSAERLRRQRQPHLVDHVRGLETQFGDMT